jgi:hypothetical protein
MRIALALVGSLLMTSGCVSNEYRISRNELQRLAEMPPEVRGQHVRMVQGIGERRADPVEPPANYPEVQPVGGEYSDASVQIDLGGSGPGGRPVGGGRFVGHPPGGVPRPGGGAFRGTPPGGGGVGGGVHLGGGGGGGGGGGNSGADALVVVAVVLVAVAAVAAVALVAAEGSRFDGWGALAPEQLLYVEDGAGHTTPVPLGALSREQAATAVEAKVMDDEWPGLRRLDHAPLDRTGGVFKLDMGTTSFNFGTTQVTGIAAQIQVGGFVNPWLGVLADIGLSGGGNGGDCCGGTFTRHSLALEIDALPIKLGPLHAGVFGKGGAAIAGNSLLSENGPLAGGGALLEVDVTSRMALTFRAGASAARFDDGWSTAGTLTGGVAIY